MRHLRVSYLTPDVPKMVSFPNAKINLGLYVCSRREDGYHNISSIFYPIPYEDALEILLSDQFSFEVSGLDVPGSREDNLVTKAYQHLKYEHDLPNIQIHLHKNIPLGAGLGGGSSDAAFAIKSLNKIFKLSLSDKKMEEYAGKIGSDCPFFIQNKPVLAIGTGNEFSEVSINLGGKYLVLVCPGIHISSAEAYRTVVPEEPEMDIEELIAAPIGQWRGLLHNDFERSIFDAYPEIKEIKAQLYGSGAVYASMSGSGSSVYGIFDKQPEALPFADVAWQGFLP